MQLNFSQKNWLQSYKLAQQHGGLHDNELGWIPLEEIAVPEWYSNYLDELQAVANVPKTATNNEINRLLDKVKAIKNDENPAETVIFSGAAELGRLGGLKTREKGSDYYRELQKRSVAKRMGHDTNN